MKLYVARHGETDLNALGRYCGSSDVSLNEKGYNQAYELAKRLKNKEIDIVVSSPMLRARQTADIICKELNLKRVIVDELFERGVGVFEGLTHEEARARYPDLWERQCTKKVDDAPDGGETLREGCKRIDGAMKKLCQNYSDVTILIICHGFVSQALYRYCNNLSFEEMLEFNLDNCEFVEYMLV